MKNIAIITPVECNKTTLKEYLENNFKLDNKTSIIISNLVVKEENNKVYKLKK